MGASTGGWLVSTTITVKFCVALRGGVPLSVTTTLRMLVPSWLESGDQANAPVAESTVALVGTPDPSAKASVSGGLSGSLAVLVKDKVVPTVRV